MASYSVNEDKATVSLKQEKLCQKKETQYPSGQVGHCCNSTGFTARAGLWNSHNFYKRMWWSIAATYNTTRFLLFCLAICWLPIWEIPNHLRTSCAPSFSRSSKPIVGTKPHCCIQVKINTEQGQITHLATMRVQGVRAWSSVAASSPKVSRTPPPTVGLLWISSTSGPPFRKVFIWVSISLSLCCLL